MTRTRGSFVWLAIAATVALLGTFKGTNLFKDQPPKKLNLVRVSFGTISAIPDPAKIRTAGEWYLLNHIGSPLLTYDHSQGHFSPLIVESWTIEGNIYTFKLRKDARFSDGSPILADDVAASIRRLLIRKTSSHFPIWEYISGCEGVLNESSACPGMVVLDDRTIAFTLTNRRESFLLHMASPEGAIWARRDIDSRSQGLNPTVYSGPYLIKSKGTDGTFELLKNSFSLIQSQTPLAPERIQARPLTRSQIEDGLVAGDVDLFIGDYIPYNKYKWAQQSFRVHETTPSSILYFFRLDRRESRDSFPRSFISTLWNSERDEGLFPADTFLPFGSLGAVTRTEYLEALTETAPKHPIRVAVPEVYFQDGFLALLSSAAKMANVDLQFKRLPISKFFSLFDQSENDEFDFALSTYVASERYPAVQLRYILNGKSPPAGISMASIDLPETSKDRMHALAEFQKALVSTQRVLPLFFVRTHIVAAPNINLGAQPTTDADLQIWKITGF